MSSIVHAKKISTNSVESFAIGSALVEAGLVSQSQIDICVRQQNAYLEAGRTLFIEQILVMNRFCSKAQIENVAQQNSSGGQSGLFQQILPIRICKQYMVYPLRVNNRVMEIKSGKPLTQQHIASILLSSFVPATTVRIIPTDIADIKSILAGVFDSEHSFEAMLDRMKAVEINGVMLRQAIHSMLVGAVELRASDIHIDKKPDPESWISYRIDGLITQTHLLPARIMAAIFTKIKTESGMDASDDRRSQDGRLSIENNGRNIDFRVATQPAVGGETMTLRVLDPESLLGLEVLFPNQPDMTDLFQKIATVSGKRGGLVIFSGPTGSGKTTSLYALVQRFPRDAMNIITVEDPVEYVMSFTRQIQLNQLLNEQSVDVERSLLRQDPDVIVLGEIRDADTMSAALQFAQSGHLVLASIHADNVPQTFQRVMSFVEGENSSKALFMLANTLRVVVNQKLIPRLCTCAVNHPHPEIARNSAIKNEIKIGPLFKLKQRKGCSRCRGTGYYGRVAAHETMVITMNETLRRVIANKIAGGAGNFSDIQDMEGVTMKRRQDTLARLIEVDVIDPESAVRLVNQEFV